MIEAGADVLYDPLDGAASAFVTVHDGGTKHGSVSVHPDPRVQGVLEQEREAEMWQAIDRLRLNIPVDELVTWKQLIGDRRLSDALAECDAKGWDALPLAPWELSRLFPYL